MFSAVQKIEDFLGDFPNHGDNAPVIEDPELAG